MQSNMSDYDSEYGLNQIVKRIAGFYLNYYWIEYCMRLMQMQVSGTTQLP